MKLSIPRHNTKLFTWVADSKCFVGEASTLARPMCRPVFDDACDLGFELVSEKTGKAITVYLSKEMKNAEGEVVSWNFTPAIGTGEFTVKVFND